MTSTAERSGDKAVGPLYRTERLGSVIEGMGDGLVLQDGKNRLLMINSAAVRMNGFADEAEARAAFELVARLARGDAARLLDDPSSLRVFSVFDQDGTELPVYEWPLSRACRHESFEGVEVTIVNHANHHSWIGRFNGTAIADEAGKPHLFVTTMQDVTARRRAELELQNADRRLGLLHEAASMLLVSDKPLTLLDQLYERLAELFGMEFYFRLGAVNGDRLELIAYRGIPEDVAMHLRQIDFSRTVYGTVATNRRTVVLEDVQRHSEPTTEFIRELGITAYVCCPLVARDTLVGTFSFGTRKRRRFDAADITLIQTVCDQIAIALERERSQVRMRNSEEHLRLALDAGHMGAFDWDLRAGKVTWDTAIYGMFGCAPGSVIDIEEFCRRVYPEDRAKLEELRQRQYGGSANELLDVDFRILRPDGEVRWIASRGRVSRDEAHRAVRINGISFDITERKRIEELQRLAHITGQVGTFHWDISNDKVTFDQQMEYVYGLDPAKTVSNLALWYACVHPEDRAPLAKAVAVLFETSSTNWQYEFRIVRPDGQIRWIEERATVFYGPDGRPRNCIGVNVDITARREAEQALRHSEARFRRLSESGILGIAFFRADGRITDANEKFLAMLGCDRGEVQAGLLRWDILTPPEWRARTRQAITEFNETGRISPYEKEYFRRDGTRFWVLLGGAHLDEEGSGVSFVLDITARKRAEQALQQSEDRFRQAFAFAPIGMVLLDMHGRFLHVNRAYCSIVGYAVDELLQPNFDYQRITHADDLQYTTRGFARLLNGEIPTFFTEMRYVRKDGRVVWVRAGATTQRNTEGKPFQILALIEDVTERKRAEQALKEADRRKDDFLAALGHELRNPLAPIRNVMHVLRLRSAHESHARWAAEVTERQVQQMTRLVDDLLDVSRINRGKLELRNETVDVADVARRAVEMTMPLIERRGHRVEVAAPPGPVPVRGDATRLTQVFANLVSNAAKFTPPKGEIRVIVESSAEDVRVRVQDNGVGIGDSALKDIFDPFQQAHQGVEQDQAGLGLGLALVQRLTQLHGGSVEALSQGAGKGSEFCVRLPRAQADARRPDAIAEMQPTARLRIVVVDDNRDVAESLSALLEMLGHEAHPVFTGAEAIDTVPRLQPDLVICDIGLPDISGHEVAARLRREPSVQSVRLVAMTGFARDSEKAKRSGFDEWFLKPIDVVVLQSMLARSQLNGASATSQKN